MTKPTQILVDQFLPRYLNEFDNFYAKANLPVDPQFIRDVETALTLAVPVGFIGKFGSDLYDKTKSALFRRVSQRHKSSGPRVFRLVGEDRNHVILDFGRVRPFFKIHKGCVLILQNVTVLYDGQFTDIIEEENAGSFFMDNVAFKKAGLPPNAPYKIQTTIIVGESKPANIQPVNTQKRPKS
jgi:hypothetical protein